MAPSRVFRVPFTYILIEVTIEKNKNNKYT